MTVDDVVKILEAALPRYMEKQEADGMRTAIRMLRERKTGKWLPESPCKHKPGRVRNTDRWTIYKCSCCGRNNGRYFRDKYCRHCGAKMEVDE